jgi:NAD(P)-dependent dehydrogenase (short-subunit alcohol dehydrogenase family)
MSKTILITGASRGIGAATARIAATLGYQVCVNYRSNEREANEIVAQIKAGGGNALALQADVSIESDVLRLFKTLDRELGPLSALVNNAGILDRQMRVEDMAVERMQRIFATNVIGSILCAAAAAARS